MAVPVGELQLAGGRDGAVDGGQQQVLAEGESLVTLGGKDGIQQLDQIQALSDMEQGGDITESRHLSFERLRRPLRLLGGGHQVVDLAEVNLANDLGLAIDALAIAGVVMAMDRRTNARDRMKTGATLIIG